jgi:UDP-N-acetylmuramoyl-tripeptide--D-alanyl-D-alanine ligase
MIALTLQEIADVVGGRVDASDADTMVSRVVTDSRHAGPGALFVALRGDQVDGHIYARDALAAGAAGVLVRDDAADGLERSISAADPLLALRALATWTRARLGARVIAITGSSGKTSTKDLAAGALRAGGKRTVASAASFNNEIGVPLTILEADETTEVLVVEVGARGIGHIAALGPTVRPHVSIVLCIGAAHVGEFGGLENTAIAKSELVRALEPEGLALLNADDERTVAMVPLAPRALLFGRDATAAIRAVDVELDAAACASFTVVADNDVARVRLMIPGEHMVSNALAAIGAALACGVSLDDAARGVGEVAAPPGRMRVLAAGARTVIDDAYNANPDSMRAALKTLRVLGTGRPTVAVLGYMAELGPDTAREHDAVGRLAVRLGVSRLIAVGTDARAICDAARLEGMTPEDAIAVETPEDAAAAAETAGEDAIILVKASRAAGLDRVVDALTGRDA